MVRLFKGQFSLSIDTSGFSLTKRGYRKESTEAPIREHVAAALILFSEWDGSIPLYDPVCGSGTFLIEAASIAKNAPPTRAKSHFAFEKFKNFQAEVFDEIKQQALEAQTPIKVPIVGSDKSDEALNAAQANINSTEFKDHIEIFNQSLLNLSAKQFDQPGLLIMNPPFGQRLGEIEELKELYSDFSSVLKQRFIGWTLGFLSGSGEFSEALRLKAHRKFPILNGRLECKFLSYKIR